MHKMSPPDDQSEACTEEGHTLLVIFFWHSAGINIFRVFAAMHDLASSAPKHLFSFSCQFSS